MRQSDDVRLHGVERHGTRRKMKQKSNPPRNRTGEIYIKFSFYEKTFLSYFFRSQRFGFLPCCYVFWVAIIGLDAPYRLSWNVFGLKNSAVSSLDLLSVAWKFSCRVCSYSRFTFSPSRKSCTSDYPPFTKSSILGKWIVTSRTSLSWIFGIPYAIRLSDAQLCIGVTFLVFFVNN